MSKIVKINETNLPALPDEEAENIHAACTTRPPTLKFKKGDYLAGETEIPIGTEFLVYAGEWRRGWKKWMDNTVVDDRVVRVASNPAAPVERDELDATDEAEWPIKDGERMDPWVLENQLPVESIETGERFLFVTSSYGGQMAIEKVCGRYATNLRKGVDKGLPIVALKVGHFVTKKWGKIARPDLEIVRWENDDGEPVDITPPKGSDMDDKIPF